MCVAGSGCLEADTVSVRIGSETGVAELTVLPMNQQQHDERGNSRIKDCSNGHPPNVAGPTIRMVPPILIYTRPVLA